VELLSALAALRGRRVVGADFVEVAPQLDPSGCTAVLGAKLVREMLLTLFAWTADEATLAGVHVTPKASH
jgi:agmatinase